LTGALLTTTSKLFALDCPYVELNRKVAGCIVVELDVVVCTENLSSGVVVVKSCAVERHGS
jgi:hypothetical protein